MNTPITNKRPLDTGQLLPKPWQQALYRPVQPLVERFFDFPKAWELYDLADGHRAEAGPFARAILDHLRVDWSLPEAPLQALREIQGPLVIAANHPYGGIDSLAFIDLLERIRPGGWKMLSNHVMHGVRPLTPHLIPVDALGLSADGARINASAMKAAMRFLREGGCLALFPARRVAHYDPILRAVVDQSWSDHSVKLAAKANAHLACLHTPGHNSERFLRIPNKYPRLRGLMLCRELTRSPARNIELRMTHMLAPKDVSDFANDPRGAQKLRARVHMEDDLRTSPKRPSPKAPQASARPAGNDTAEPAKAPDASLRLFTKNPFDVFLFRGDQAPHALDALGRARSVTFRAAGQGTDKEVDLTPEDDYYHHLVVWDNEAQRLAGAYRIGLVPEILREHGQPGLYLDHVFHIDPAFFQRFPRSMELSRSFVLPDYQKDNRVLPLLWKGLAATATRHEIDTLFGSVTISNAHHPASRALLVEYLKNNYADSPETIRLVRAREPFVPETRYHPLVAEAYAGEGLNALNPLIQEIEQGKRAIPPLMRYYCQLGAKYIDYHVEADFGNALYCLLRVHLPSIPEAYKKRFFQ